MFHYQTFFFFAVTHLKLHLKTNTNYELKCFTHVDPFTLHSYLKSGFSDYSHLQRRTWRPGEVRNLPGPPWRLSSRAAVCTQASCARIHAFYLSCYCFTTVHTSVPQMHWALLCAEVPTTPPLCPGPAGGKRELETEPAMGRQAEAANCCSCSVLDKADEGTFLRRILISVWIMDGLQTNERLRLSFWVCQALKIPQNNATFAPGNSF